MRKPKRRIWKTECDDEFYKVYYDFNVEPEEPLWLDRFTDYLTGGEDAYREEPFYRARFALQILAMIPLAVCLLTSLSKNMRSAGLRLFCWNCVFVNGMLTLYVSLRFIMLEWVYPVYYCSYSQYDGYPRVAIRKAAPKIPGIWRERALTEDLTKWTVFSMALCFLALRYTTYRACTSPLNFRDRYSWRWWACAVVLADVLPAAVIPFAGKEDALTEFHTAYGSATPLTTSWYIHCAMIAALGGGIWIAETAVICVSIRAIIRYRATARRTVNSSAPGGSLLTQLGPLLCFSALPCLETLSSVYMSLSDGLTIAAHTAAIECAQSKMASYNVPDYSKLPVADIYDDCGAVPLDYFNIDQHSKATGDLANAGRILCAVKPFFEAFVILFLIPCFREAMARTLRDWWRRIQRRRPIVAVAQRIVIRA